MNPPKKSSPSSPPTDAILLASYLAQCGVASRRASEKIISSGEVSVNHAIVTELTTWVNPAQDRVHFKKKLLRLPRKLYYLLHKPRGYACTIKDPHAARTVYDLIPKNSDERVFSIGRLDLDSEGLLLFTNDGDLANKLTHPRYQIERTYRVEVEGNVTPEDLKKLEKGIFADGESLIASKTSYLKRKQKGAIIKISVREGRKREIRRMCRYLGYRVNRLVRIAFGPLRLGAYKPGLVRKLTLEEVRQLQNATRTLDHQ